MAHESAGMIVRLQHRGDFAAGDNRGDWKPTGHALSHDHDIWNDAGVFHGKQRTSATPSCDDLIGNQEDAQLSCYLADMLKELPWGEDPPPVSEHGLQDNSSYIGKT